MTKALKEALIHELAGGGFISGQSFGEKYGVSRTAISKHINQLSEMGLDVFRVTGKGYKLAQPISLLDKESILAQLKLAAKPTIEIHHVIDSTNSYLIRRLPNQVQNGQICLAEFQSAGRGRRGRQWISPFGSHLYLSMYWHLEAGMSAAMGLSAVTALAVNDTLNRLYNINAQLKWPNDIYLNGVKLAGILIDLEGQPSEACHCVVGIGLNLVMPDKSGDQVDQPWTDLQQHVSQEIDRNEIAATLIECLQHRFKQHQKQGLQDMMLEWKTLDYFYNKAVKIITGEREILGTCKGINNQGALLLEIDNKIHPIYGGEVSLRSA